MDSQSVDFGVLFLLLSIMHLRFIQVVVLVVSSSFLCISEYYSIAYMHHNLSIHLQLRDIWVFFQFLRLMSKLSVYIYLQICVLIYIIISRG